MPITGIGELAHKSGVKIETIRYYERIGLLPTPTRGANRRRIYTDEDLTLVCFVRHARDLGFNLAETRELLTLRSSATCEPIAAIARRHLTNVRAKLDGMQSLEAMLAKAVKTCAAGVLTRDCAVLAMIESGVVQGQQVSACFGPPKTD